MVDLPFNGHILIVEKTTFSIIFFLNVSEKMEQLIPWHSWANIFTPICEKNSSDVFHLLEVAISVERLVYVMLDIPEYHMIALSLWNKLRNSIVSFRFPTPVLQNSFPPLCVDVHGLSDQFLFYYNSIDYI